MKSLLAFLALCGVVIAIPPAALSKASIKALEEPIAILSQESDNGFDGSFTNNFETGNGIAVEQTGVTKTISYDKEDKVVQEIIGSYSYTAPDGTPVKVEYIANEQGFQPQGDVLPVAPPPSPIIARALKFIEEHPQQQETSKV